MPNNNVKNEKTFDDLKKAKNYLQQIINNSKDFIITTNSDDLIVEFNPEAEEQLGYRKEEVINKPITLLWKNSDERNEMMGLVKKYGAVRNKEVCLLAKNGDIHYVSLTLSQLKNNKGKVVGTVGISKDISEHRKLHHKLQLSEKLASVGTLASGIAHELNNPLAGILGMAEAIIDEDDIETVKSFTKDIIEYTLEASSIIKELSQYSRTVSVESVTVIDLSSIMEKSIKIAKLSLNFSGITVSSDFKKGCRIKADPGEMQQVFTNLITNAVQAMEEKGGKLTLSCSCDDGLVKAAVEDTGTGIKKDYLSQLYNPFFTTKPPGKGTGLGLYAVDKILLKYKGNMEVKSAEGIGTSFILTFPESTNLSSEARQDN